jgi:hypothetical protein
LKKLLTVFAFVCLGLGAHAQNLTTVNGSNITDINGTKLAAGQLCFLITDSQDNPISVSIGGGGQALKRGYCSTVTAGVVTSFTVPNPANTSPSGIYYRVTVKDSSTGQEVLRYALVSFTGATFNFDNYAPVNLGSFAPLTGNSVSGNLSVTGNVAATGTVTGSNIPGSIPGAGACAANQYVTALNTAAPPTCTFTATGTGIPVQATSPTLVTPNIGAATGSSLLFNSAATGSGAVLTVGGTSATTGGVSIFVGAPGSSTERLSVVPADGGSAAARVGALSVRTPSLGFLTGTEVASISTAGAIAGASAAITGAVTTKGSVTLQTASGTLPATISNDGSGGVNITSNAIGTLSLANGGTVIINSPGAAAQFRGATSGTINVAAPPVAGSNSLTLPAANDTLVARTTTDTLTNKTLTSPAISDPTITGTAAVKRLRASQGTPVVISDWTITGLGLGSWGTTASVVSVTGNDTAGSVVISCSGTGQSANPAFRLTFHDGAFAANPVAIATRGDGFSPTVPAGTFGTSTTSALFGLNGICVAGVNYAFYYWVIGN